MKFTKRQIALAGFLGLALVVLAVDQLRSGSAASGSAVPGPALASGSALATATTESTPGVKEVVSPSSARPSISQRLRNLRPTFASGSAVPNAFAAQSGLSAASSAGVAFPNQIKLTGVMFTGKAHFAVINGRSLRVGESIDGYRLVSVSRNAAQFELGQERITLTLAE